MYINSSKSEVLPTRRLTFTNFVIKTFIETRTNFELVIISSILSASTRSDYNFSWFVLCWLIIRLSLALFVLA